MPAPSDAVSRYCEALSLSPGGFDLLVTAERARRAARKAEGDPRCDAWIQTASGLCFKPWAPDPVQVRLSDVAHALSNICRFNGHTIFHYSVAQHSILVATELEEMTAGDFHARQLCPSTRQRVALLGLVHDAAEAYVGDIVSPIKRHVPVFDEIETLVMATIYQAFKLEPPTLAEAAVVREADLRMLLTEKRDLHRSEPQSWQCAEGLEPYQRRIIRWSPGHVEQKFVERFYALHGLPSAS